MGANIILWIKGNLTAPLNLNTPLLLFSFVIIMIVMPYYDDYVDDPIHVDATAANSTKAQPEFSPGPLPGGDVRGLFGKGNYYTDSRIVAIPFLIKKI
jgi:hypothetical protein